MDQITSGDRLINFRNCCHGRRTSSMGLAEIQHLLVAEHSTANSIETAAGIVPRRAPISTKFPYFLDKGLINKAEDFIGARRRPAVLAENPIR
jgi:hypothetical protein